MKPRAAIAAVFAAAAAFAASSELDVARRALGDGLWSVAAKRAVAAEAAATNDEQRAMARIVELEALAGAARPAEMLVRLNAWPDAGGDAFRYWRAWACASSGKADVAQGLLERPFDTAPYVGLGLRLAARLAVERGEDARELFAKASVASTGNPVLRAENAVEWARALERAGDAKGALDVLTKEEALNAPGSGGSSARLLAAELSMRTGDAAGGRRLLEGLVAAGTNTDERAYVLAACALSDHLLASGATNDAVRAASNAVARARLPELVRHAGYALGFALFARPSSRAEGIRIVEEHVRRFPGAPESAKAQFRLADGLLAVNENASAVRAYDALLQAYPEHDHDVHALEGRAWAFFRLGRNAEAVGAFARAAQVATSGVVRARCLCKQAEALVADGRFEEGAAVYGTVDDASLRDTARYRQADALVRSGRTEAALAIFSALAAGDDDMSVKAGLRVAALKAAGGRFEHAVEDYNRMLGGKRRERLTDEQYVQALSGRGRSYYGAYRFREAAADFAKVAEKDASRCDEMGFLSALCLYGDGRDREARLAAVDLAARIPDSPLREDLLFWIAKCDAARRDWAHAVEGFEACATNAHAAPVRRLESYVRAARCAIALPDFPKVVELAGRAVTNAVSAEASAKTARETAFAAEMLVLQGEALVELARFDEALLVFEQVGRMAAPEALQRRAALKRADCLFARGATDAKLYRGALDAYRAILRDEDIPDSMRLTVAFQIGRTLEKLHRLEEAADQYYVNVVMAYWDAVRPDAGEDSRRHWFDEASRALFARAAFNLADYYESRSELRQAERVLGYLVAARVSAADEAKRRIARLKEKGGH